MNSDLLINVCISLLLLKYYTVELIPLQNVIEWKSNAELHLFPKDFQVS